ncbi:hypothetical protein F7P73_15685 [Acinetobacter bohemicus]|uniref:Uncharacterized protein n=1 Tax=Acinetobacter bohemicus TaxID=1435036 RepID=A0A1I6W1A2_9GAMM|nr:hypothetical protein [Acinetobacter bohemicus]KAB0650728.1 hypothetical protein F7P73_15685 [Acinetobacter bohemicus]SFT19424.1 hypothetical protein SAMN05444586_103710 [Acinetobacter bohemicus]
MPIETKDLVLYESERLTDNDDGGGKYNGQIIVDGQSNNLFDDVSELDRTMGDVSMRKIFPAVTTNDTDKLMGATVFISENPKDPNVSALLFSTKNWTDERQSAQNRVENYLAKGGQIAGTPLDTHWLGMKQLQVAMFPQETESSVGDTIVLVSDEGKALEHEQYLRIIKVETRSAIMVVDGKNVEYKITTYMLNDPLDMDFVGLSASQWYKGQASKTIIRDSIVADTGSYYASAGLSEDVQVGEFTVNAESIFSQIIPSAQTESPIIDVNAAGESTILVPGNDGLITASFPTTVGVSQNLYIGSSVMPSSVAFTLFGQPVTDQGGLLKTSSGTQVGIIDYQRGLIQWTSSATTGATTLVLTFKPAAAPNQYFQSYAMPVTQNNQSTNWTGVLVPIPAPGSLSISYMSQGKFYELKDDGSGQLKGSSSSFGSGRINYETGSWLLTTGALPDVDTPILLLWGTPIVTFVRSNLSVNKAAFEFNLGQVGIAPGVTINWLLEGVAKTAVSNAQGKFTGDATGEINYATGMGKIIPNKLPQKNTQFTVIYDYGNQLTQTKSAIAPDGNQKLSFIIGTGAAIQPNSVELSIPVSDQLGQNNGTAKVIDVPINSTMGNLVSSAGDIQGTINYNTGAVEVTPILTSKQFKQVYTPTTVFGTA